MPWCRRQRSAGRARLGERPRRRTARDSSLSFSQRNDGPTARCLGRQSPDALVLGAGELLDTIVSVVHDVDVSARIGRHTNGFEIEPPAPRCQEGAAPVELLDAGVEFRYVHVPGRIGQAGPYTLAARRAPALALPDAALLRALPAVDAELPELDATHAEETKCARTVRVRGADR